MVVARMSVWKFKSGQRENAVDTIESIKERVHRTEGFRGDLFLLSKEDPDSETVVAFWEDERTERASAGGIFQVAIRELEKYLASPPEVSHFTVYSVTTQEIMPQMAKPM
jgi:heme-degrading monooxygenase HmoA